MKIIKTRTTGDFQLLRPGEKSQKESDSSKPLIFKKDNLRKTEIAIVKKHLKHSRRSRRLNSRMIGGSEFSDGYLVKKVKESMF